MNKFKLWLEQTMMISFAILVGIIIEGPCYTVFGGDPLYEFKMDLLQMVSIVLTGAVCSLPTVIWLMDTDMPKNKYIVRIVLHCIGLYAIVSAFGWIFNWYNNLGGFIFMTIIYFLVYIFVWVVSLWFHKRDDNKINKALDDIRDEE
jgi:ABC-type multidrug transport system fused ATPase/permease subunit